MKKYQIQITETLQRVIEVEANNYDEAEDKVNEDYRNGDIVLDYSDYMSTEIERFGDE